MLTALSNMLGKLILQLLLSAYNELTTNLNVNLFVTKTTDLQFISLWCGHQFVAVLMQLHSHNEKCRECIILSNIRLA